MSTDQPHGLSSATTQTGSALPAEESPAHTILNAIDAGPPELQAQLHAGCDKRSRGVIFRATRGRALLNGVAEGATPGTAQAKGPRVQQKSGERYERGALAYPPKGHTVTEPSLFSIWMNRAAS